MSRSPFVWTVTYPGRIGPPVACFTVKHELKTWLDRRPDDDFAVWRHRDGHRHPDDKPVRLERSSLEPIY